LFARLGAVFPATAIE
jgi:hypothetical protein